MVDPRRKQAVEDSANDVCVQMIIVAILQKARIFQATARIVLLSENVDGLRSGDNSMVRKESVVEVILLRIPM